MMGGSADDISSKTQHRAHYETIINAMQKQNNEEQRKTYMKLLGVAAACTTLAALLIYGHITKQKNTAKYISPSKIEAKAIDIDPHNEGLEQLLTIDGKQYTLQEINGEPTLVKYEKKN